MNKGKWGKVGIFQNTSAFTRQEDFDIIVGIFMREDKYSTITLRKK